jgi:hypothetical protein
MRWLIVAGVMLASVGAMAQIVDQDNALVVYFDEEATQRSWYGTGPVTAYIVAGPMVYWNGNDLVPYNGLDMWLTNLYFVPLEGHVTGVVIRGRGNATPAEIVWNPVNYEISFSFYPPLPLSGRTVIADLEMMVVSDQPTEIHIEPGIFMADGMMEPLQFAALTSGPDGPMDYTDHVANINAASPIAAEMRSWSAVKSLFR